MSYTLADRDAELAERGTFAELFPLADDYDTDDLRNLFEAVLTGEMRTSADIAKARTDYDRILTAVLRDARKQGFKNAWQTMLDDARCAG